MTEDPCEDCSGKLNWYCRTCCPVHRYEDLDEEEGRRP